MERALDHISNCHNICEKIESVKLASESIVGKKFFSLEEGLMNFYGTFALLSDKINIKNREIFTKLTAQNIQK